MAREANPGKEVIFVTVLREQPTTEVTRMPIRSRSYEYVFGVLGVLTAAVGAWMYYVPADWFLGGLVEGWYFGMFIAAGLLLTAAFGLFARTAFVEDHGFDLPTTVYTVLALVALGGAIVFALIWIL
jgi:hypothetical protein